MRWQKYHHRWWRHHNDLKSNEWIGQTDGTLFWKADQVSNHTTTASNDICTCCSWDSWNQDWRISLSKLRPNWLEKASKQCQLPSFWKKEPSLFGWDSDTARKQFNTSVDLGEKYNPPKSTLQILGTLVGFVQTLLTPEKLQLMAYGEHLSETASWMSPNHSLPQNLTVNI